MDITHTTPLDFNVSIDSYEVLSHGLGEKIFPWLSRKATTSPTGATVGRYTEILSDIQLSFKRGQLTGILGPSGCGKTTLLNIICQRATGVFHGDVYINGIKRSDGVLSNSSGRGCRSNRFGHDGEVGLVYATDVLLPFLTVRETLHYSASLRLADKNKVEERVNKVLSDMRLDSVADTRVGNAWRKGLSSGEMRRLSIGVELITNPPVLVLDEPTSCLDSVLAYEIVRILKKLTESGQIIIATIHQPSSSITKLFDQVVLMAKGQLVYAGPLQDVVPYFHEHLQIELDENIDIASALIEVASGFEQSRSEPTTAGTPKALRSDEFMAKNEDETPDADCVPANQLGTEWIGHRNEALVDRAIAVFKDSSYKKQVRSAIEDARDNDAGHAASPVKGRCSREVWKRRWLEISTICRRSFKNSRRNPLSFISCLFIQALMGIFCGALFLNIEDKYLPPTIPIPIGDPSSIPMQAINSQWAQFVARGIDGNKTNPLIDMLVNGVDGSGSQPINEVSSALIWRFQGWVPCVYKNILERRIIPSGPYSDGRIFDEYQTLWEGDDHSNPNKWVGGPYTAPHSAGDAYKALQILQEVITEDWKIGYYNCLRSMNLGSFMACFTCNSFIRARLAPFSSCVGLPEIPGPQDVITDLMMCGKARTRTGLPEVWADPYPELQGDDPIWPGSSPVLTDVEEQGGAIPSEESFIDSLMRQSVYENPQMHQAFYEAQTGFFESSEVAKPKPSLPKKRRLQASALIGGSIESLKAFLPPMVRELAESMSEYRESIEECTHPYCSKISDTLANNSFLGALSDYGSVMGAILNVAGTMFFAAANIGFASYDSLIVFPTERALINRENSNKLYTITTYFLGKSIADLPFQAAPSILLSFFFYVLIGLQFRHRFGAYLGVCILAQFSAYGFGYFVSALSPTMEVAVCAAPLAITLLICCSGFFVRDSAIPSGMTWLKYLSYFRWSFFALLGSYFPTSEAYNGLPNSFGLAIAGITETKVGKCCLWMVILAFGFRLLACLALRYTNRKVGVEE